MISVSNDIGRLPGEKTDLDTLTGKITVQDFSVLLKEVLPNFHKNITQYSQLNVGQTLVLLHKLARMSGEPFDVYANIRDTKLPDYLHSLLLAIKANRDRIEALYAPVDC